MSTKREPKEPAIPIDEEKLQQTILDALKQAVAYHEEGNLEQATLLYQSILDIYQDHPDANHNMGMVHVDKGNFELALPYLHKAVTTDPSFEQYWISYLDILSRSGQKERLQKTIELAKKYSIPEKILHPYQDKV